MAPYMTGPDRSYKINLEPGECLVAWVYPDEDQEVSPSLYLTSDCNNLNLSCPVAVDRNDEPANWHTGWTQWFSQAGSDFGTPGEENADNNCP